MSDHNLSIKMQTLKRELRVICDGMKCVVKKSKTEKQKVKTDKREEKNG